VIVLEETSHDSSEIESLKEQLKKEQARAEEYLNNFKYLLAEYDNYRKQVEKDLEIKAREEVEKLLVKLIDLRDDYVRAIEIAGKSETQTIVGGLESILKNLDGILKERGVREIDAVGKAFDPNIHEAVSFVNSEEYPENTVTAEIRKGYMLSNRVIRPSLVEVSKKAHVKSNGDDLDG